MFLINSFFYWKSCLEPDLLAQIVYFSLEEVTSDCFPSVLYLMHLLVGLVTCVSDVDTCSSYVKQASVLQHTGNKVLRPVWGSAPKASLLKYELEHLFPKILTTKGQHDNRSIYKADVHLSFGTWMRDETRHSGSKSKLNLACSFFLSCWGCERQICREESRYTVLFGY